LYFRLFLTALLWYDIPIDYRYLREGEREGMRVLSLQYRYPPPLWP